MSAARISRVRARKVILVYLSPGRHTMPVPQSTKHNGSRHSANELLYAKPKGSSHTPPMHRHCHRHAAPPRHTGISSCPGTGVEDRGSSRTGGARPQHCAADDDFSDLAPLAAAIGDARIVQLGETTHGDGAAFLAKVRLVKFLHQHHGFDVLHEVIFQGLFRGTTVQGDITVLRFPTPDVALVEILTAATGLPRMPTGCCGGRTG